MNSQKEETYAHKGFGRAKIDLASGVKRNLTLSYFQNLIAVLKSLLEKPNQTDFWAGTEKPFWENFSLIIWELWRFFFYYLFFLKPFPWLEGRTVFCLVSGRVSYCVLNNGKCLRSLRKIFFSSSILTYINISDLCLFPYSISPIYW